MTCNTMGMYRLLPTVPLAAQYRSGRSDGGPVAFSG